MNKQDLIGFEKMIADKWDAGLIKYPVHLSGGNEDELIEIFKDIKKGDWVFSTHRSHYHYLLKARKYYGIQKSEDLLEKMIMQGRSMHIMDKHCNFFSSGIVAGCCAIAVGVAKAIKEKSIENSKYFHHIPEQHVYCFVGDGATDEGHYLEALSYAIWQKLPITFIIEDNDRSVCSSHLQRRGSIDAVLYTDHSEYVKCYKYNSTYPHVGTGKTIKFLDMGEIGETL